MDAAEQEPPSVDVAWSHPPPLVDVEPLLHPDEIERAHGYVQAADRARFATGRALLRSMVADAIGRPRHEIVFDSRCPACGQPHGRPRPVLSDSDATIHTSVSHCGEWVVVVASAVPVGVDVEACAAVEFDGFDAVALTAVEQAELRRLPEALRPCARTEAWVQKEAVLKLRGDGLAVEPSGIHLGISSEDRLVPDPLGSGEIALVSLPAGPDYRACLAVASPARPHIRLLNASRVLAGPAATSRTATE